MIESYLTGSCHCSPKIITYKGNYLKSRGDIFDKDYYFSSEISVWHADRWPNVGGLPSSMKPMFCVRLTANLPAQIEL